jgi:hypothetical protein
MATIHRLIFCGLFCLAASVAQAQTPGPPTALQVVLNTDQTLTLQWTGPSAPGAPFGYVVQIGTAPGGSDVLNAQTGVTTTYQTQPLTPGTYYVRVYAFNGFGVSSPSTEVVVTVSCAAPPAGAQHLAWRPLPGNQVQVVWTSPLDLTWTVAVGSSPGASDVFTGPPPFPLQRTITFTLAPGTYYIRIGGQNACGLDAPVSAELIVVAGAPTGVSPVLINELGAFIELKNTTSQPVDIGNWTVLVATGAEQRVARGSTLSPGTVIGPGCTYLLAPTAVVLGVAADAVMAAFGPGAALVNPAGRIIDSVAMTPANSGAPTMPLGEGTLLPFAATGSYARIADQDTNNNAADFIYLMTPTPQNAAACLLNVPPGAPRNLTRLVTGNTVALSWAQPDTGGSPTHYRLEVGFASGAADAGLFDLGTSPLLAVFGGVPNGTYYARLRAVNDAGVSAASNEVQIVVCGVGCNLPPGPVTNLVAQVSGSVVLLTWTPPGSGPAPTNYVIEAGSSARLVDLAQVPTGSASPFVVIAGVPPGTYYVRVRASSHGVTGPPSDDVIVVVVP